MRIGVDIDEVLTPLLESFLQFYNKQHGTSFVPEECQTYHIEEVMGIPLKKCIQEVEAFYRSEAFAQLQPFPNVQQALKELKNLGHELIVITSRYGDAIPPTKVWITQHFPDIFSAVHFVTFRKSKAGLCKENGVDVLIEDDVDHIQSCNEQGVKIIIINKPWNKKAEGNFVRVENWDEIIEEIRKNVSA